MKTGIKLIGAWMILILLFSTYGALLTVKTLEKENQKDQYLFEDQTLPSIHQIGGERQLVAISYLKTEELSVKTYTYENIEHLKADLQMYAAYVMKKEGFTTNDSLSWDHSEGTIILKKNNMYIHLDWTKTSYRVLLREMHEEMGDNK